MTPTNGLPRTNGLQRNEADKDMAPLRDQLRRYCAEHSFADYDAVNLLLTLKRTAHEFNAFTESYCEVVGLSPGRLSVLMVLNSDRDRAIPLSEIGDRLVVTRANITGLIDGLAREGLVRRVDHPDDRRMVLAQLTDKGRKFMTWFAPQHHGKIKSFLGRLSRSEKRSMVALLDKLRSHLRSARVEKLKA